MLPSGEPGGEVHAAVARHVEQCPDCRREMDRYERLALALASLGRNLEEAPAGLFEELVAIPSRAGRVEVLRRHIADNRRAYLSGAAVALLGAAGATMWRTRARRLATA
jgi:predicted anti-sigma-YlaC factor YlaD